MIISPHSIVLYRYFTPRLARNFDAMPDAIDVIIIGAGLSGLALAQSLSRNRFSYKVYESDTSLNARAQGYRVRISDEGIQALEESLTKTDFSELESSCNINPGISNIPQATLDATSGDMCGPLFRPGEKTPMPARPLRKPLSADRSVLRRSLLEGIEDCVVFGEIFEYYVEEANGGVIAHFKSGLEVKGSVLVGADGTWSRVRQNLLPSFTLVDTEARLIFGKTHIDEKFVKNFSPEALQGLTFIRDTGLNCLLEPMRFSKDRNNLPADYVYWVLFLRCDSEKTPKNILDLAPAEVTQLTRQLTNHWHCSLKTLFENSHAGQSSVLRILSVKPEIPDWGQGSKASVRVTLIGDAAHAMCPAAALGATTALRDANKVSASLKTHGLGPQALREYEDEMRKYASKAIHNSLLGGRNVFQMRPFDQLPEVQSRSTPGVSSTVTDH
jgi:2-polyprenyl-6-methoxyphenol hydroxylase-like FAD-dependent oxidoreductase